MEGKLIRLEKKLNTFINAAQSAFEKFHKDIESFNERLDVINDRLDAPNKSMCMTNRKEKAVKEDESSSGISVPAPDFNNVKTEVQRKS
jgi:hypothetical protein